MTIPFDRRFLLLIGIVLFLIGIASILTGETFQTGRYIRHRFVDRSEEPNRFWWIVVTYLLVGLVFIGLYVARISN
jgi:hypothetical protein